MALLLLCGCGDQLSYFLAQFVLYETHYATRPNQVEFIFENINDLTAISTDNRKILKGKVLHKYTLVNGNVVSLPQK